MVHRISNFVDMSHFILDQKQFKCLMLTIKIHTEYLLVQSSWIHYVSHSVLDWPVTVWHAMSINWNTLDRKEHFRTWIESETIIRGSNSSFLILLSLILSLHFSFLFVVSLDTWFDIRCHLFYLQSILPKWTSWNVLKRTQSNI